MTQINEQLMEDAFKALEQISVISEVVERIQSIRGASELISQEDGELLKQTGIAMIGVADFLEGIIPEDYEQRYIELSLKRIFEMKDELIAFKEKYSVNS